MLFLREAPFVRLVVPMIMGIILYHVFLIWNGYFALVIITAFLFLITSTFLVSTRWKYHLVSLSSSIFLGLICVLSFTTTHFHYNSNQSNYVKPSEDTRLLIRVTEPPILKGKYYKMKSEILRQDDAVSQGLVVSYLELSEKPPNYGDEIFIQSDLVTIPKPRNPMEFDYARFMRTQNIEFQTFVLYGNWFSTGRNSGNVVYEFGYSCRNQIAKTLEKFFTSEIYLGILKALMLGDKSEMDGDLKQKFIETGTMHVLAVSGLHVGIVYLFTNSFFGMFFRKRGKIAAVVLSLTTIWFFALITGFSPSVSRACFMFSFLSVGAGLKRPTNVYNSLSCAAFFLLLINPLSILNLGFQFSFLAVIGIVSLQKPLRNLCQTSSWFWSKVLDLTAVSTAAQIATLPLALFYFGQFPSLFFLSNLIVIPAITVLLYAGLALLLFSKIPILATIVVFIMKSYLWFITGSVVFFQSLPFAFVKDIYVSQTDFILVLFIVLTVSIIIIQHTNYKALASLLAALLVLNTIHIIRKNRHSQSTELIYFDVGYKPCVVMRKGLEIQLLSGDDLSEKDWDYHCRPYLVSRNVRNTDYLKLKNDLSEQTFCGLKVGHKVIKLWNSKTHKGSRQEFQTITF